MNPKLAIYHLKHPVTDKVTAWFPYAAYLEFKASSETYMDFRHYLSDMLLGLTDGEGNSLVLAITEADYNTDISKLSMNVLGD